MIKRGKYFLPPPRDGSDFKELFQRLAAAGAGRPADKDGFPQGPWTPDLLSEAISLIDANGTGVELRTVQLWFQDNDKGISAENIRWLARIFGCDDPEATSDWQAELSASQSRLVAKRRERRRAGVEGAQEPSPMLPVAEDGNPLPAHLAEADAATSEERRRYNLGGVTEGLFSGSPLNLASGVFGGAVALGFTSYFLGIHDVKFNSPEVAMKQVGFLWAPNWTFLFLVFMPLFFAFTVELLHFWKEEGRAEIAARTDQGSGRRSWRLIVEASSSTFWVVFVICILFAGVFQWISVRLLPLLRGGGDYATDWGSLALARPDVISVAVEIGFTGFAYLYMCLCFYLFFAGLMLLYTIAHDFSRSLSASGVLQGAKVDPAVQGVGVRVMIGIFRCVMLSILIAICMKLQSAYLTSSGANIASWLLSDTLSVIAGRAEIRAVGDYSAPNHFSSLIIVLSALFVFLYGASRVGVGNGFQASLGMMLASVVLLVVSYLFIGAFAGFSVLLGVGVSIAVYGLIKPAFGCGRLDVQGEDQIVS